MIWMNAKKGAKNHERKPNVPKKEDWKKLILEVQNLRSRRSIQRPNTQDLPGNEYLKSMGILFRQNLIQNATPSLGLSFWLSKDTILHISRWKGPITHTKEKLQLTSEFSTVTLMHRREWSNTWKSWGNLPSSPKCCSDIKAMVNHHKQKSAPKILPQTLHRKTSWQQHLAN